MNWSQNIKERRNIHGEGEGNWRSVFFVLVIRRAWQVGIVTIWGSHLRRPTNEESGGRQEAGPTAFAPFPETTDYFGDSKQVWMVNFRVRDLDAMVAQLRGADIAVKVEPQVYPNGRFAVCTILKAIRLNCGNQQDETLSIEFVDYKLHRRAKELGRRT